MLPILTMLLGDLDQLSGDARSLRQQAEVGFASNASATAASLALLSLQLRLTNLGSGWAINSENPNIVYSGAASPDLPVQLQIAPNAAVVSQAQLLADLDSLFAAAATRADDVHRASGCVLAQQVAADDGLSPESLAALSDNWMPS
ncbi:MAG: hypothetical protein U0556_18635 [Dehalococcoidia bacterium]